MLDLNKSHQTTYNPWMNIFTLQLPGKWVNDGIVQKITLKLILIAIHPTAHVLTWKYKYFLQLRSFEFTKFVRDMFTEEFIKSVMQNRTLNSCRRSTEYKIIFLIQLTFYWCVGEKIYVPNKLWKKIRTERSLN